MPGPRFYAPENRQSGFEQLVGGLLGGFKGADEFRRGRKQEIQADEDRARIIDRQARADAIGDYEAGIATDGRTPMDERGVAPQGAPVFNERGSSPDIVGSALPFAQRVGQQLGGAMPAIDVPPSMMPAAPGAPGVRPTPPFAPAPDGAGDPGRIPGVLQRIGSLLSRGKDNALNGGYHGHQAPTYDVRRTGPSAREREQQIAQDAATGRERETRLSTERVGAANNRTAIRVAEISAAGRSDVASMRFSGMNDPRLKVSMDAMKNQIASYEKAMLDLDKLSGQEQESVLDDKTQRERKAGNKARYAQQRAELEVKRNELIDRYQNMTMAAAAGVEDLAGFIPPATPYQAPATDPNAPAPITGMAGARAAGAAGASPAAPASAPSAPGYTRAQIEQMYQNALSNGADPQRAAQRRDELLKNASP